MVPFALLEKQTFPVWTENQEFQQVQIAHLWCLGASDSEVSMTFISTCLKLIHASSVAFSEMIEPYGANTEVKNL